jgi:hypothetical protein
MQQIWSGCVIRAILDGRETSDSKLDNSIILFVPPRSMLKKEKRSI